MFLSNPITNLLNNAPVASNIIEAERTVIGFVLNWVRLIGTGLALIMLTYMSIRYMTAQGPHEKAELKKSFINYLIGAVVLIGATNIIYYAEQLVEYILKDIIA